MYSPCWPGSLYYTGQSQIHSHLPCPCLPNAGVTNGAIMLSLLVWFLKYKHLVGHWRHMLVIQISGSKGMKVKRN